MRTPSFHTPGNGHTRPVADIVRPGVELWRQFKQEYSAKMGWVTVWIVLILISLITLIWIFIARALVLIDGDRSPSSAWTMSFFLFLLEAAVPASMGYMLSLLWHAVGNTAEEVRYFRHLAGRLQTNPSAQVWHDAADRLTDDIEVLRSSHHTALPEEADKLESEIVKLEQRLRHVKEWHPTRPYRRDEIGQEQAHHPAPSEDPRDAGPNNSRRGLPGTPARDTVSPGQNGMNSG